MIVEYELIVYSNNKLFKTYIFMFDKYLILILICMSFIS
jgi:hypothetical protein